MTAYQFLAMVIAAPAAIAIVGLVRRAKAIELESWTRAAIMHDRMAARPLPPRLARPPQPPIREHLGGYRDAAPKSLQDQVDELRARINELEARGVRR